MNKIIVNANYYAGIYDTIELPEQYTYADIASYHIKWGTLYIIFKDKSNWETELSHPEVDTKNPLMTTLRSTQNDR